MEVICLFGSFEFWLSIKVFTDSIKQSEIKCYYPTLLLFIRFNAWANTWCIFPLTESHFKLDHVYFQQNLWIFFYTTVIIDQDQGAPPQRSLCRNGWLFSPLCFKRKCLPVPSHMCSVHFKWSVICNEILDCLIFHGLIWSKSLITWSQSGHKIQSKHC